MYGGDVDKAPADPYTDSAAAMDTSAPNGDARTGSVANGGRGRSRSRSRSASPGRFRSPRRSPPAYSRRRSPAPARPRHAPAPTPSQVLGVFGLSIRTQERQLEDEFNRYGQCEKVTIVYDARTGRSRGFGFIRMSAVEEATACIEKLNGVELDGRRIRVDYSITDRPHAPTPGEYMGARREPDRRPGRYDRDRGDSYSGRRDRGDRERDPYGRDSYRDRDYRDRDRDREYRDRRSPAARGGGRYSASPPPRRRRSYSRSPRAARASPPRREDEATASRW